MTDNSVLFSKQKKKMFVNTDIIRKFGVFKWKQNKESELV